jgi:hypothetical protein
MQIAAGRSHGNHAVVQAAATLLLLLLLLLLLPANGFQCSVAQM